MKQFYQAKDLLATKGITSVDAGIVLGTGPNQFEARCGDSVQCLPVIGKLLNTLQV